MIKGNDLTALAAFIGSEPIRVQASAAELRSRIQDPAIEIQAIGDGVSRISRQPLGFAQSATENIFVEDVPQPARAPNGKSALRIALEALPANTDRSVFVGGRSGKSLYTILNGIRQSSGYLYRTHDTVREGARGTRIWRTR